MLGMSMPKLLPNKITSVDSDDYNIEMGNIIDTKMVYKNDLMNCLK